jgi:hypothetical protein
MKTHDVIAARSDVLASVHRSHDGVIAERSLSHLNVVADRRTRSRRGLFRDVATLHCKSFNPDKLRVTLYDQP